MKVIVLGAGIIGTSTAWFLRQQGHDVTVIERQPGAAQETSFANGGQISVSHAEPWANPSAPLKVLKWLGKEDAPLLFRPRAELLQWQWGLQFLRECTQSRTDHNIRQVRGDRGFQPQKPAGGPTQYGFEIQLLNKGNPPFYTDQKEFDSSLPA